MGYPNGWYVCNTYDHVEPKKPGCYAIYLYDRETYYKKLVYIGTAKDIEKRTTSHEIVSALRALTDSYIIIKCKVMPEHKRRLVEKKLIARLKPRANRVGK